MSFCRVPLLNDHNHVIDHVDVLIADAKSICAVPRWYKRNKGANRSVMFYTKKGEVYRILFHFCCFLESMGMSLSLL